jgi:response regulator RpfG family c-di-GMP phosphodiesterase
MRRIIFEKALQATPAHSHGASKALLSRHHLEEMVEQRTKELQMALKRIGKTYNDTLETLAAALDLRDSETAGQSRRVTRCSLHMAKRTGCSGKGLTEIARGAYLHDQGKIGIPDAILLEPGTLTPGERGQ